MANLILPSRFTQQPQYPVVVDERNPLSDRLVFAHNLTSPVDASGRGYNLTLGATTYRGVINGESCLVAPNHSTGHANTAVTTKEIAFGANEPLTLVARFRGDNADGQGAIIGCRGSTGTPILSLWIGPNGYVGTTYEASMIARDNANSITGCDTNTVVYEGNTHTAAMSRQGGSWYWSLDGSPWAAFSSNPTNAQGAITLTNARLFGDTTTSVIGSTLQGAIYFDGLWRRGLSNNELVTLHREYWTLSKKRPQILYFDVGGGGATDLTIADATHSHSADNTVLTSSHLLTVADATHAHSADNLDLSTAILLALADALHGHTADNLTLTLAGSEDLVIADASHAHTADNLSLTTLSVLVVAEALHSHLADNVVLSLAGTENLVIADAAHAHTADNLSLTSQLALSIAEATHAHTADGIVITSQHVLAVADALHAHLADNLTLSDAPSLTIADASHGHSADNLALTMDSLLAIADAAHAHLADEIELTSAHTLAIVEAMHAHMADNVTLSLITLRAVELLIAAARDTQLTAAARDTTLEARYEFHG